MDMKAARELRAAIITVADLIEGDATWEEKFDAVFAYHGSHIDPLLKQVDIDFDYYDPDTSYQEDVCAYILAVNELRERIEKVLLLESEVKCFVCDEPALDSVIWAEKRDGRVTGRIKHAQCPARVCPGCRHGFFPNDRNLPGSATFCSATCDWS